MAYDFSTDATPRQQKATDGFLVMDEGSPDVPGLVTSFIQKTRTEPATTYTFALPDSGFLIFASGASPAFTLPLGVAVAFETGTEIILRHTGTGRMLVNITGAGTLNGKTAGVLAMPPNQDVLFWESAPDVWEAILPPEKYAIAIVMAAGAFNL